MTITPPSQPGEYKVLFEIADVDGLHRFGDVLSLDFVVSAS